jgi:hypothetical protein
MNGSDYDPETDDIMLPAIGGGVILEGPAGEYVQCKRPVDVLEVR